jgi:hypothetical protein
MGKTARTLIDRFIAATEHGQLSQRIVAREVVIMLRHYPRLTPPVLQSVAALLKMPMPRTIETGELIAGWLRNDGWIEASAKPFAGRGMSAVNAYEPTDKWRKLVEEK